MTEDGNVSDLTIEILQGIRSELVGLRLETTALRQETTALRQDMGALRQDMGALRQDLNNGLADVRAELGEVRVQLHELADFTQAGFKAVLGQGDRRFIDHEGRLRRLEEHAGFEPPRR